MAMHFNPSHDDDEFDQAACGTWIGEASHFTGDWGMVTCRRCLRRKDRIMNAVADIGKA